MLPCTDGFNRLVNSHLTAKVVSTESRSMVLPARAAYYMHGLEAPCYVEAKLFQ